VTNRPLSALVVSTTAFTLVIIGTTVVNVALPSIHRELGGSTAGLQWVINAYTLMLASLLLSMGALYDQRGGRRVMLDGITLFVIGAALAAAAPDLAALLAGQVLLGTGVAALLPASLALISSAYPNRRGRSRAVAIYASASAIAIGLGPVVGGLLIDAIGWRAIFAMDVPLALIVGALVVFDVADSPRAGHCRLDPGGQVTAVLALAALTFAVIQSGTDGWLDVRTLGPLALAIASGAAFIAFERRARPPMLPLSIFGSRAFSVSAVAGLLVNFAVYGQFFVLSLYLQDLRGLSALTTGLFLLVQPGAASVSALAAGVVAHRRGPRLPVIVGGTVAMLGPVVILAVGLGGAASNAALLAGLALLGAGAGFSVPGMTVAVVANSRTDQVGISSASFTVSRQVGGILGVAVLGALVGQPVATGGIQTAVAVALGALAVSAVLGLLIPRAAPRADGMTVSEAVVAAEG
jgi:DHA2 family methylenomycin A resistance protein-like MFS transporter